MKLSNDRRMRIALHVLAWMIVFLLPYLLRSHYDENRRPDGDSLNFSILNSITGIFWIIAFYLNASLLVPKLIYKQKYLAYSLSLVALFAAIIAFHLLLFAGLIKHHPVNIAASIGFNFSAYLLTIAVSTTYQILTDRNKHEREGLEKQEQQLKTEVAFLRSQVSPHFLFNVLNNLVALIRLGSTELEPTVMKLASLLQYMLYDTDEEKVTVKEEIGYLRNYIDLQEQRFGQRLKINISLEEPEQDEQIEPMLLIPFVENAFKHGVGMIENPFIDISLKMVNHELNFTVRNKYNPGRLEVKDKNSGIGLANVSRRLSLLYPGRHSLLIHKDDHFFNVSLHISLH